MENNNMPDFVGFAEEIVNSIWNGTHPDPFDIQEAAVRRGLLEEIRVTESCGENCMCQDMGEFPMFCYRKTYIKIGE